MSTEVVRWEPKISRPAISWRFACKRYCNEVFYLRLPPPTDISVQAHVSLRNPTIVGSKGPRPIYLMPLNLQGPSTQIWKSNIIQWTDAYLAGQHGSWHLPCHVLAKNREQYKIEQDVAVSVTKLKWRGLNTFGVWVACGRAWIIIEYPACIFVLNKKNDHRAP
jgi:hypothetical protein